MLAIEYDKLITIFARTLYIVSCKCYSSYERPIYYNMYQCSCTFCKHSAITVVNYRDPESQIRCVKLTDPKPFFTGAPLDLNSFLCFRKVFKPADLGNTYPL